jgi:tRNA-specific 2-thiouridylase
VSDAADARRVAVRLGVPFYAVDAAAPFQSIIGGFLAAYREGRTPNPCVRCNSEVKFGALAELADRIGAATVATGHYARVRRDGARVVLRKSVDSAKDQSYVLSTLTQEQLARAEFPLGGLRKDEVRRLARDAGLPVADKPESQEIWTSSRNAARDRARRERS